MEILLTNVSFIIKITIQIILIKNHHYIYKVVPRYHTGLELLMIIGNGKTLQN